MLQRFIFNTTTVLIESELYSDKLMVKNRYILDDRIKILSININGKNMPTQDIEVIIIPVEQTMVFYIKNT